MSKIVGIFPALERLFAEQTSAIGLASLVFVIAVLTVLVAFLFHSLMLGFFWAAYLRRSVPLRQALKSPVAGSTVRAELVVVALTAAALGMTLWTQHRTVDSTLRASLENPQIQAGAAFPLRVWPNESELGRVVEPETISLGALLRPVVETGQNYRAEYFLRSWLDLTTAPKEAREASRRSFRWWLSVLAILMTLGFVTRLAFLRSIRLDDHAHGATTAGTHGESGHLLERLPLVALSAALLFAAPSLLADSAIAKSAVAAVPYLPVSDAELSAALRNAVNEQGELYRNLRLLRTDPEQGEAKTVWDLLGSTQSSLHNLTRRSSQLASDADDLSGRLDTLEPEAKTLRADLEELSSQVEVTLSEVRDQLTASVRALSDTQREDRERGRRERAALGDRFGRFERLAKEIDGAISRVDGRLSELRASTRPKLAQLDNFLSELPRLESRLSALEDENAAWAGRVSRLDQTQRSLAQRIEALEQY